MGNSSILKNYHHMNLLKKAIKNEAINKSTILKDKNEAGVDYDSIAVALATSAATSRIPNPYAALIGVTIGAIYEHTKALDKGKRTPIMGTHYGMFISDMFHKYLLNLETIESDDDSVKEKRFNVKIFKKYSNSLDKTKAQINYLDYKDFGTDTNFGAHALISKAINNYLKAQGYGYSIDSLLKSNMDEKGYYINIPIKIHKSAISESLLTVKAYRRLWQEILTKYNYDDLDDAEGGLYDRLNLPKPYFKPNLNLDKYYLARSLYMILDRKARARISIGRATTASMLFGNSLRMCKLIRIFTKFSQDKMMDFFCYRNKLLKTFKETDVIKNIANKFRKAKVPKYSVKKLNKKKYAELYDNYLYDYLSEKIEYRNTLGDLEVKTGASTADILYAANALDTKSLSLTYYNNIIEDKYKDIEKEVNSYINSYDKRKNNRISSLKGSNVKVNPTSHSGNNGERKLLHLGGMINNASNKGGIINAVLSKASNKINIEKILSDSLPKQIKKDIRPFYNNGNRLTENDLNNFAKHFPNNEEGISEIYQQAYQIRNQNNNDYIPNSSFSKELLYV